MDCYLLDHSILFQQFLSLVNELIMIHYPQKQTRTALLALFGD